MPKINVTDALGLDADGKVAEGAKLLSALPSFLKLAHLKLDEVPIADASAGLDFGPPIDLGGGLGLTLGGAGGGRFTILRHEQTALDVEDQFAPIDIAENEIYLVLSLSFSVSAGASAEVSSASFGFSGERSFEIRCYRRFERGPDGFPELGPAFASAAGAFLLPRDASDLDSIAPDTVLVWSGNGTLTVSAGVTVSMPVQSLASVSLPKNIKLEAKAGAEVSVNAGVTIFGGYQVRLRRIGGTATELGIYTTKSREADLTVSADIGATATVGGFELTERVIGALSQQPVVDLAEFQKALPDEDPDNKARRIQEFQEGIEDAISTKLQISVEAALAKVQTREADWLFEIDSAKAVSDAARAGITASFRGHFEGLTADPQALPAGIRQAANALTDTDVRQLTVKLNLLGLANAVSIGKLVQMTTTEHNGRGEVTLVTDSSNASRLKALVVNFGNDRKRLRKLLSEDFLIEAAYRATDLGVLAPSFQAIHRYYEVHDSTGRDDMKDNLDVVRVLGMMDQAKEDAILATNKNFGRTDFYAEAAYGSDAVRSAFLQPAGQASSQDQYERVGRRALGELLAGDRGQEFRQRVASDDGLWRAMKERQNRAQFPPLFGLSAGAVDPRVEAAGADFSVIQDWAESMVDAGEAVRQVDALLTDKSVAADDARLTSARQILNSRLNDVVKRTKEEFGDPLGMVMFYEAAKRDAGRKAIISGEKLSPIELSAPKLSAHA